ncbi:MAG: hopanoid-associated sugar epimerase [Syntrophobacteraceae bacterium]
MPTAFVTGGTGFVGHHLVQLLLRNGWEVTALRRGDSQSPFVNLEGVRWCVGDIRDLDFVRRAMAGAIAVFHVAADYRLWVKNPVDMYATNVAGTGVVLEAALANRVERVVYTSTVGALGSRSNGLPADEETPTCFADMVGHYKRSKYLAERKAEGFLPEGLDIVFVHPSTPVGPGDYKPTPTGKIIVDFLCQRLPAFVDTGLNLIHVKDVAAGHLLALERGRTGEKYILGNHNLTLSEILLMLEDVSGIRASRRRLPLGPVLLAAQVSELVSRLTGREPLIPLEGVRMARKHMYFDASKAVRNLGLPQTPVWLALREAVDWFRGNGYTSPQCGSMNRIEG